MRSSAFSLAFVGMRSRSIALDLLGHGAPCSIWKHLTPEAVAKHCGLASAASGREQRQRWRTLVFEMWLVALLEEHFSRIRICWSSLLTMLQYRRLEHVSVKGRIEWHCIKQ